MMPKFLFVLFGVAAMAGAALQSDIEFAKVDGVSLKMDAWIPDGEGPFPTVVLVHGGGWQQGDKQTTFNPIFEPLSKAGFVWFTVNYRLAPKYHYPAAVDDVVSAIRFIEEHASEFKVDPKRIAPVTYIHKGMPPYLIVVGTGDQLVGFRQSQELCDKMKQAGAQCEIYPLKDAPHWLVRWENHPEWAGYKQKVPEWLKQQMK
jgi:acetyl esterase/lipase